MALRMLVPLLAMNKQLIILLGWVTLLGFSWLGFVISWYLNDVAIFQLFESEVSLLIQVPAGLLFGTLAGALCWAYVNGGWMRGAEHDYTSLIRSLDLNWIRIVFISFCAGVGEEILFRGAIQPYLGVWITAVFFVAIHGYLNPKDLPLSGYGLLMVLVVVGFGYGTEYLGLVSSISAHFAIDVVLLWQLNKRAQL